MSKLKGGSYYYWGRLLQTPPRPHPRDETHLKAGVLTAGGGGAGKGRSAGQSVRGARQTGTQRHGGPSVGGKQGRANKAYSFA